jgi:hypothetical protein
MRQRYEIPPVSQPQAPPQVQPQVQQPLSSFLAEAERKQSFVKYFNIFLCVLFVCYVVASVVLKAVPEYLYVVTTLYLLTMTEIIAVYSGVLGSDNMVWVILVLGFAWIFGFGAWASNAYLK